VVDWSEDSSDSVLAPNFDVGVADYIAKIPEAQAGIRLGRGCYCENREMTANEVNLRMYCIRLVVLDRGLCLGTFPGRIRLVSLL
jgi:hypothetical protein